MNTAWMELHLIQQDKRNETEAGEDGFPPHLWVAMATAADGGRLISCTAVELREGRERETRYLRWRKEFTDIDVFS